MKLIIKVSLYLLVSVTFIVIVYAIIYGLNLYDPGVERYDAQRGLKRGVSNLTIFYSITALPALIYFKKFWTTFAKLVLILAIPSYLVFYVLSCHDFMCPGPIGAAQVVGYGWITIAWSIFIIKLWKERKAEKLTDK